MPNNKGEIQTMKKKHPILHSFTAILICSLLAGCGAAQTTAYLETTSLEESVPASEPEEEPSSAPETTEAEETPSSQPIETEETVTSEETVPIEELKITEMDAVMYATTALNIREEPSTDAEKIGSLSVGEEVHVTGQTEDGLWTRITEGEGEAFVASNYRTSKKPEVQKPSESESTTESTPSQTETPPQESQVPQEPETVVTPEPQDPNNLPDVSAPDLEATGLAADIEEQIQSSGDDWFDSFMSQDATTFTNNADGVQQNGLNWGE